MSTRAFAGVLYGEPAQDLVEVRSRLSALPDDIKRTIFDASSTQLSAGWGEELSKSAPYSPGQASIVKSGNRVIPHSMGMTAETGFAHPDITRQYEFGTLNREEFHTYRRRNRKNAGTHDVTRRTKRQLPTRSQTGWIAYPAAGRLGSRVFGMFLQIIVKKSHDALEAGN